MPGGQSAVGLLMLGAWEAPLEATPLHLVQQLGLGESDIWA